MKTSFLGFLLAGFITIGLGCETIHADDERPQFGSDHEALKLIGVWGLQKQFSIGIQNAGTVPFKAFRATLVKINDFDESEEVLTLEYSSEADYRNAKGQRESPHILESGQTIFFNHVASGVSVSEMNYFSPVSSMRGLVKMLAKAGEDQEATIKALLAEGRFMLKVAKVVQAEAKDLSVMRERPIETPRTPVPKSKEELAEKNVYPQK